MGPRSLLWLTMVVGTAICSFWVAVAEDMILGVNYHSISKDEQGQRWVEVDMDEYDEDTEAITRRVKRAVPPTAGKSGRGFNHDSCFNVSRWGDLKYENMTKEKCTVRFEKKCDNIPDTVCADVPFLFCEIVGYSECNMTVKEGEFIRTEMTNKEFKPWKCYNDTKFVPHTKMVPKCWNETRRNCLTEWRENPDGTEVWDPEGGPCETVTWQRCELQPTNVLFKQPFVRCNHSDPIPYEGCVNKTYTQPINAMDCSAKGSVNCRTTVQNSCRQITYMDCEDRPVEECKPEQMRIPTQEWLHRKKCLLPDPNDPHHLEDQAAAAGRFAERSGRQQADAIANAAAKVVAEDS